MESSYLDDEQIDDLNVSELKGYLRKHAQPVTGRKKELILRAKGVRLTNLKDVNRLNMVDGVEANTRAEEKNTTPLGEKIPEMSKLLNWTTDLNCIPEICDKDIYNYFVLKMHTKIQLRSKVYYEDGHVHGIQYNKVSDDCSHCVVRSKVMPSIPTANKAKNPDHDTWVIISKETGNVHAANCDCAAGMGESCNHIAALMYAMVDICIKRNEGKLASTSIKQKWHIPRKRKISPKKAQDLVFRKYNFGDDSDENKTKASLFKTTQEDSKVNESFKCTVNTDRLKERLQKNKSNCGWLTFFEKPKIESDVIPDLLSVEYQYHDEVDLYSDNVKTEFERKFNSLHVSESESKNIETMTRGQSKNSLLFKARKERITSSYFGSVCKQCEKTKPDNLIKDILGYKTFSSEYTTWGKNHEPAARRQYQNRFKVKVQECGLFVHTKYPYLGTSPDGLVGENGLIEIKCPAKHEWKNATPEQCADDSNFYCYMDNDGHFCLKRTHKYFFQVQGQLALTSRKWCDFVVWTLKGLASQRIFFDEPFWNDMQTELKNFYTSALLPELFSSRVKRGLPLCK